MALNSKQQMFWTNEKRKLSDLKPWERNPRQIKDKQAKLLAESFSDFGQVETIAISANGDIYNGHQRLSVLAGKYGMDYEVDVRVSSRDLTEKERERLTVYLHRGATGEWSWDELANWDMSDLLTWGFEESDFPFDVAPATNEGADAEPQIDKAEELRQKWDVQSGQMWQLGEHRIICGDCTDRAVVERVMGGEKADCVVTDSPYGINREGIENDDPKGLRLLFDKCLAVMPTHDAVIINFQSPRLFPVWLDAIRYAGHKFERLLWMYDENDQTKPWHYWLMCSQAICISSVGKPMWAECKAHHDTYTIGLSREWRSGGAGNDFSHASVKPVGLIQDLMSHTVGVVYEPFSGSGTTLIACENLSRKCRAVEISPAYVAVAIQRWVDVTGKEPILLDA